MTNQSTVRIGRWHFKPEGLKAAVSLFGTAAFTLYQSYVPVVDVEIEKPVMADMAQKMKAAKNPEDDNSV